jgi:hypothetical protein
MKKMLSYFFAACFLLCIVQASAQQIASFSVKLDKTTNLVDVPVSINLDELSYVADSALALFELQGQRQVPIAFQIKHDGKRIMHWLVNPKGKKEFSYVLALAAPSNFNPIKAIKSATDITFNANNRNLLRYNDATVYPPAKIDTIFKRSGFIHPLWTPRGQELTRIQAPDHYHHYGIWNPWTHVAFEKDTVDFWNLNSKQGTVRFAKLVSKTEGPVFSEIQALHEHVVLKKGGGEKVALNELQTIRVYQPEKDQDYYIVDITSQMNCATESPFNILAYRYAGMGWRTTGFWNNTNCEVLTSEGKTRKDTDGSRAKWCIVQGELPGNETGGVAFLGYPANYNFPEPMRIWTLNTNGRGDMFFNFAPTKDRNWLLEPGKTYVLKYRLVVFNGKFDQAKAESAWQGFAHPPAITLNNK